MSSLLHPASRASAASGPSQQRARVGRASAHPRQSSGVYNTFSAKQIHGFREAFSMLDADGDGAISRADLAALLANLGVPDARADVERLVAAATMKDGAPGAERINFTQFLTMFGEHLSELDEAPDLLAAFECFDERDEGTIDAGELRYWLGEVGDRMSDDEIDRLLSGPFMDRGGRKFDYKAFVEAVKMSEPASLES
ncbi:EF-hand [Tilletiopsis washingtonensis]|uniref:EF-hand n=1 Tax=Tilletiopsis washingtonensis TaxID=58919 RepID=A0A316Z7X6_9BASI|nr:EF-hand [Tilletiopsis washingtonensis]PWN97699.1 EF-hand [Tilletiopsis washingtonensis]